MNTRHWLRLALLAAACLGWSRPASAEVHPLLPFRLDPPANPSHRIIEDSGAWLQPEGQLRRRLERSRATLALEREEKKLKQEAQKLAADLLKNPELVEAVKKQLKDKEALDRLQEQVRSGNLSLNDPALQKLLREAMRGEGKLTDRQARGLQKLAARLNLNKMPGGLGQPNPENPPAGTNPPDRISGPQMPNPAAMPPAPSPPEPSAWERLQAQASDWVKDNIDDWIEHLDEWADSPVGKSWRDALEAVGRRGMPAGGTAGLSERTRGLTRYLPPVQKYLPRDLGAVFRKAPTPSFPRVGKLPKAPGLPSAPAAPGRGALTALLWLLLGAVLAFALWKSAGWYQAARAARAGVWKLGPWPVAPCAVSTRGELVRAFEYLALLCLGPAARTRHHLELAEQIGGQGGEDPAQQQARQAAARHLASLYEQARYAPDDQPLPAEEMARARRELEALAGVSPA
jgi:hypothetical protein